MNIIDIMKDGFGVSKTKIEREMGRIPEAFLNDLRQLMKEMRNEGGNKQLNTEQRDFFKTYGRQLAKFV